MFAEINWNILWSFDFERSQSRSLSRCSTGGSGPIRSRQTVLTFKTCSRGGNPPTKKMIKSTKRDTFNTVKKPVAHAHCTWHNLVPKPPVNSVPIVLLSSLTCIYMWPWTVTVILWYLISHHNCPSQHTDMCTTNKPSSHLGWLNHQSLHWSVIKPILCLPKPWHKHNWSCCVVMFQWQLAHAATVWFARLCTVYTHFLTLVPCEKGHTWPKTN